jgi:hypothetical protein
LVKTFHFGASLLLQLHQQLQIFEKSETLWLLQAQEHTYIFLSQPFKVVHSLWNLVVLQIAQRNGVELDVDLALGFASHYCKIGTMECLVDDGNAEAFLGPLMRAAERGCMEVSR